MHRYTTTELHGMATGTQDTTKAIRDELDIYKDVSVRMMEQTSAKVQKNADITEELRLVLEKFLNTAQASVVEQTTFVSQPVVSKDEGKTQERVADSGASAPTSTAEGTQQAKCEALGNETKAVHAAEQSTAVDEVQVSPMQDEIHHSNNNNGPSNFDAEHGRFTSPPSAPVEKVAQEKKSSRPKCSTALNPPLPLEQSSATPTMSSAETQDTELLNAVRVAARKNNVEMLGLLLDMGVDVNAVDPSEGTALQQACFGSFQAVRYLLQRNADPNIGKGQSVAKRPRYAIT